jgi:hypothetical protein
MIATGVDLAALLDIDTMLAEVIGRPVASNIARAGPRSAVV